MKATGIRVAAGAAPILGLLAVIDETRRSVAAFVEELLVMTPERHARFGED